MRLTGWAKDSLVVTSALPPGVRLEFMMGGDGKSPARGAKMYLEAPNDTRWRAAGRWRFGSRCAHGSGSRRGRPTWKARDFDGGLVNVIGGKVSVAASPRGADRGHGCRGDGRRNPWLRDQDRHRRHQRTRRERRPRARHRERIDPIGAGHGGTCSARVGGGAIHFLAATARGDVVIDSHSGAIDVALPLPGDFLLFASSITGAVESRYDRTRTTPGREGTWRRTHRRHGDSPRLTAHTFKTITVGALGTLGGKR